MSVLCAALWLLELLVLAWTMTIWEWLSFDVKCFSEDQVVLYLPQNGESNWFIITLTLAARFRTSLCGFSLFSILHGVRVPYIASILKYGSYED